MHTFVRVLSIKVFVHREDSHRLKQKLADWFFISHLRASIFELISTDARRDILAGHTQLRREKARFGSSVIDAKPVIPALPDAPVVEELNIIGSPRYLPRLN